MPEPCPQHHPPLAQPGQEARANSLGAESLDSGFAFKPVDFSSLGFSSLGFASLGLWEAPGLPPVDSCD